MFSAAKSLQSCPTLCNPIDSSQPTRLPSPRDSPGKNTGVGCHFLLQCMKVKSESEVTQSCPTLRDPMDCSLPGSSVRGIFQARKHCLGHVKTEIAVSYIPQMISPTIQNCHEDLKTNYSMYTKKKVFLILTGNMTLPSSLLYLCTLSWSFS